MALVLDFNICQSGSCDELIFSENTGLYNAITNPNGWGDPATPTIITSNATAATLTLVLASGNSYVINLLTTTLFPTNNSLITYLLPNGSIGYTVGSAIADQIIVFTYSVTVLGVVHTQTKSFPLMCNVQCCVNSMFINLDFECDSCRKIQVNTALDAFARLKGLCALAGEGNSLYFNNTLIELQKICKNSNCKNCK